MPQGSALVDALGCDQQTILNLISSRRLGVLFPPRLELCDCVRLQGERTGHSAVVVEPMQCGSVDRSDHLADSVVVVLEIALEDRLMVRNPVPQSAEPVEHVVDVLAVLDAGRKNPIQVGPPNRCVVGIREEFYPEPEGQLRYSTIGRDLLLGLGEPIRDLRDRVLLGWAEQLACQQPILAVAGAHCAVNGITERNL